jgi:sugar O-acyltransferase (sialic acid O-acetyltransferase NeuD family)
MGNKNNSVLLIGLGGHALVVIDALHSAGRSIVGYCDREERTDFVGDLVYFGNEDGTESKVVLTANDFLVTIGDNALRQRVSDGLQTRGFTEAAAAVHATTTVGSDVSFGRGTQVQGGVFVNAKSVIGRGVILNTACIVEHECVVGDFVHVAPGVVLAGNVTVGAGAFIGANATVIQGVTIGANAIVGAGTVVLRDVPAGRTVVGNPAKQLAE